MESDHIVYGLLLMILSSIWSSRKEVWAQILCMIFAFGAMAFFAKHLGWI